MKSLRPFPYDQPDMQQHLHSVPSSHVPTTSVTTLSQQITDTFPLFVHLDNKVTALQQEVSSLTLQVQSLNQQLRESQHMNLGGGGSPLVGASGLVPAEPIVSLEARQDRVRVLNASRFVTLSGRDGECVVDALPSDGPGAPWAGQMTVARLHTLTAAQVNAIIDHYSLERVEGKHAVPPGELKRRIYLIRFLGIPA